ncbi:MAG: UDP-N-acetylmuramate dehydrogenase [Burkholderiaceae bacterium]|nr:UDP-N-acetylmuramate dehydrogenase [Burkholderiaceae bacterium]
MFIEKNVALEALNTFHIVAKAQTLVRIDAVADVERVLADPVLKVSPKFVLGGGSNIIIAGDVVPLVLKVDIKGIHLVRETDKHWIVEAGAGENWHDFVTWTLYSGYPGLENLALIPGSVGASPVQNIGAYGVELQDRFHELDAINLETGETFTLNAAQCAFGYRDSVFKHVAAREGDFGLCGKALITHVRFALPKAWKAVLGYADLEKKMVETGHDAVHHLPAALQIYEWICDIRHAKLPDPALIGNAGSFFKNPTVSPEQCADIIQREPKIVHYHMDDGGIKLAAGWLIDACGWKGKSVGNAAVYEKQALVLVNKGNATGGEVMTLAKAIQTSVYERFGIRLEPEPVVV